MSKDVKLIDPSEEFRKKILNDPAYQEMLKLSEERKADRKMKLLFAGLALLILYGLFSDLFRGN